MTQSATVPDLKQGQAKNLALATLAFAISFWAWNMIAPLAVRYTEDLGLTSGQHQQHREHQPAAETVGEGPGHDPAERADQHGRGDQE